MTGTSESAKKQLNNSNNAATHKNENNKKNNSDGNIDGCAAGTSGGSTAKKARKRKRCEIKYSDSDLESEFEDCDMEDAIAIERKLQKIARNNSLSDDEMRMLLQKFVKNEHILALVTLKAEDALKREEREAAADQQRAIIITDTPSVPKLTRARARELNRTPAIALPSLSEHAPTEIASLIKDDLHSDDDDEEYTFKAEDFMSDDEPNTTASDLDSNPRTPQTPLTQAEDSPMKLTADGCFKMPLDKQADLRIATRTRSKFCLQQTTIEDLQSEFIPPDVEHFDVPDADMVANEQDWMQFLNDFSKPLNNNFMGDDDDPVNDPEYDVAADKMPLDAEELRDVNISKKELTELVAELFEGLLNEGVSLESVELETPQKFLNNNTTAINESIQTPPPTNNDVQREAVTRQIDFDAQQQQHCVSDATISSTNITQTEYAMNDVAAKTIIPIAKNNTNDATTISLSADAVKTNPELIALPVPGKPNCYQLAKVVATGDALSESVTLQSAQHKLPPEDDTRYTTPYDINYTWKYISIKKHVYSEYMDKFENLKNINANNTTAVLPAPPPSTEATGMTAAQHDLLQQQLRIHVQLCAQNFLQTYSHPDLWKFASKPREMLRDLQQKAATDASFNAWNLQAAVELTDNWEQELSVESEENSQMMQFVNNEIERTNGNTRQIARFPPRIMERMLNSNVFMYPEYLPRVPFTSKLCSFHHFSPAESHLIALGLEKHMINGRNIGLAKKRPVSLRLACERMSKDTVFGKTPRRIWDRIKILRNAKYYNPVKYFFEHGRPPPTDVKISTFANNNVLPPRERVEELPLAWQKYIREKQAAAATTASEEARSAYFQIVREVVDDEEQATTAINPSIETASVTSIETATITKRRRGRPRRNKEQLPPSVTINVNYVFGNDSAVNLLSQSAAALVNANNLNNSFNTTNLSFDGSLSSLVNQTIGCSLQALPTTSTPLQSTPVQSNLQPNQLPIVSYNFDGNRLQPNFGAAEIVDTTQSKLTDYYDLEEREPSRLWEDLESCDSQSQQTLKKPKYKKQLRHRAHQRRLNRNHHRRQHYLQRFKQHPPPSKVLKLLPLSRHSGVSRLQHKVSLHYRQTRNLRHRFTQLLTSYRLHLQAQVRRYQRKPLLQYFFRHFKALALYTELLIDLKMNCKNAMSTTATAAASNGISSSSSPLNLGKRARSALAQLEEDASNVRINSSSSKKLNRQEENFRNMLQPDSAEDANRKDAIYAFNFYEKVEEVLKSSKRPEDSKRFNHILKSFDPKREKVSDLYYKLENLFLPEYPELAQVFLTFLLPSEAAEIGKFFEHFMATNMTTFINKLNIYFNKQPAQIRKVYNCLSELAEESDVNIKTIETKILPLLKGNQFLIDWFMQLFPQVPPPERLLSTPEHVNLKEAQSNQSGEHLETLLDLMDSPTQEQQQQQQHQCQLRYINGRIFYGSKITLPAKLSFMALSHADDVNASETANGGANIDGCIHAIREHGETRLIAATAAAVAAAAATNDCGGSDDAEKSEEEYATKALIIDTTGDDDSVGSSIETCDDATLHAHAVRLNPNYYGNSCYSSNSHTYNNPSSSSGTNSTNIALTSTPNASSNAPPATTHQNAKKTSLNFTEDLRLSPRKQQQLTTVAITQLCQSPNAATVSATGTPSTQTREKTRRSPTKKSCLATTNICSNSNYKTSPTNRQRVHNIQPMVVIHEQNSAIACAQKLKSLIEDTAECEPPDSKAGITIVARAKHAMDVNIEQDAAYVCKLENTDDMEFLPVNAAVNVNQMEVDSPTVMPASASLSKTAVVTAFDSDEDCKLDIVATLATSSASADVETCSSSTSAACVSSSNTVATTTACLKTHETADLYPNIASPPPAWTRDEDKIILIEMKLGSRDREDLFQRIRAKLPHRSQRDIAARHQFLIDFLSKLQGK